MPSTRVSALILFLSLSQAGCGVDGGRGVRTEDGAVGAAGTPDGPLLVAADVGFAPHAMARPDGSAEGFNIDLAEEIARRLGQHQYRLRREA